MTAKTALIILVVSVGAIGCGSHHVHRTAEQLRGENEVLEAKSRELAAEKRRQEDLAKRAPSAQELERLQNDRAKLAALKASAAPAAEKTSPVQAAQSAFAPRIVSGQNLSPADQWKNAGRATPQAVIETYCWAIRTGNVEALAQCIVLDSEVHEKVTRSLEGYPGGKEKPTAVQLVASALVARNKTLQGLGIGDLQAAGVDHVVARARLDHNQGRIREYELSLRRTAEGWVHVVSDPDNVFNFRFGPTPPK